jgi:HEAT repeat protein
LLTRFQAVFLSVLGDFRSQRVILKLKELGDEHAIPALIEVIGDNDRDIYAKFEALGVLVKLSQSIE